MYSVKYFKILGDWGRVRGTRVMPQQQSVLSLESSTPFEHGQIEERQENWHTDL